MSAFDVGGMATALPDATQTHDTTAAVERKNPQEAGWVVAQKYDYDTYNKSTKEQADARAAAGEDDAEDDKKSQRSNEGADPVTLAVGGLREGDWASNGAIYEWDEEYGDIGPRFADLEEQLFGNKNNHVRMGVSFDK